MRSRGSYRSLDNQKNVKNGSQKENQFIKLNDDLDEEMVIIEDKQEFVSKSMKSYQRCLEVITIDSDEEMVEEEEDDIIFIDEMSNTSDKTKSKPVPKKCNKCLKPNESCDYEELTSADFYLNPRIHPEVIALELRDKTRFQCFVNSMAKNRPSFENKTVLIIGSGNGILALFAAQLMARNVIVYDRRGISSLIESVIETNRKKKRLNETNFYIIEEELDLNQMVLPNGIKKVDVIVSDWVNHSLFFKSMVNHFIIARDKWLKEGGLILPDRGHMYLSGAHDYIHTHTRLDKRYSDSIYIKNIDYWSSNVYGFDMTSIRKVVLTEPIHDSVNNSQIVTNEFRLKEFNFYDIKAKDLNFSTHFVLNAKENHYLQTFVLFFDVIFSKNLTVPQMYSTKPYANLNLFRPTIFFLPDDKQSIIFTDDRIEGDFKYSLSEDLEQMSVNINFELKNKFTELNEELAFSLN